RYIIYPKVLKSNGIQLKIPEDKLAEIHGNIYKEICTRCGAEHLRPFPVEQKKHSSVFSGLVKQTRYTGRLCEALKKDGKTRCMGKLKDSIINFGEYLPEEPLRLAEYHAEKADLTLVIGSSMRVSLPSIFLLSYENGGKFCICNRQVWFFL